MWEKANYVSVQSAVQNLLIVSNTGNYLGLELRFVIIA